MSRASSSSPNEGISSTIYNLSCVIIQNCLTSFRCPHAWFLLGLAFLLSQTRYRLLPDIFLFACLFLWLRKPELRRARILFLLLTCFLLMEFFLPFDLSILYWPGRPRIVPLVMGLPTAETAQRARRGEIALGGCIVSGNEPRWILIG
jgi:hypothetical protein